MREMGSTTAWMFMAGLSMGPDSDMDIEQGSSTCSGGTHVSGCSPVGESPPPRQPPLFITEDYLSHTW